MQWECFMTFVPDESVRLIGAEAAGRGIDTLDHAATIAKGSKGIFSWNEEFVLTEQERPDQSCILYFSRT